MQNIEVAQKILSKNDLKARELRESFAKDNLFVINIMSAPGSGKTTMLERFSEDSDFRFAVIEGDLETNRCRAFAKAWDSRLPNHHRRGLSFGGEYGRKGVF